MEQRQQQRRLEQQQAVRAQPGWATYEQQKGSEPGDKKAPRDMTILALTGGKVQPRKRESNSDTGDESDDPFCGVEANLLPAVEVVLQEIEKAGTSITGDQTGTSPSLKLTADSKGRTISKAVTIYRK